MTGQGKELIFWIGPLCDEAELEGMIQRRECATASANLAEWNYLKYFAQMYDVPIVVWSALRTIEYPKNSRFSYPSRRVEYFLDDRIELHNVGYCNLFGISHLSREHSLVRAAKDYARQLDEGTFVQLFVYSMHLPFMRAAAAFKRIHPNCSYKLIVPDLPLNMDTSTPIRRVLKQIDWARIRREESAVDGFVLYTKQMADYLDLSPCDYMVCEGVADLDLLSSPRYEIPQEPHRDRVCIYVGSLDKEYRVENLVMAFGQIDDSHARLEVYGTGSGEAEVRAACESIRSAYFGGFIPNAVARERVSRAFLVINPRPTNLPCASYSCPSKTLEAMASGTAMLTTRLSGIPLSYQERLLILDDSSISAMASSLYRALSLDAGEINRIGKEARCFIQGRSEQLIREIWNFKR